MGLEIIDIVDEKNRVIGKDIRTRIHERGFNHRSVHIFVVKGDKIFMQKRHRNAETFPGFYDSSAAGHVQSGESYEDAAARELEEELNVRARPKLLHVFDAAHESKEFAGFFVVEHKGKINVNTDEVGSGEFMKIDEIKKIEKLTSNFRRCLEWYIDNVKSDN